MKKWDISLRRYNASIKISKFGKIAYSYDELIYYDIDDGSRSSTTKDFHAHMNLKRM